MSRISLLSVDMQRLLWLKCWSVELSCKKRLVQMSFDNVTHIKEVMGSKSTILPQKKMAKAPAGIPMVPETQKSSLYFSQASGSESKPSSHFHHKMWTPKHAILETSPPHNEGAPPLFRIERLLLDFVVI